MYSILKGFQWVKAVAFGSTTGPDRPVKSSENRLSPCYQVSENSLAVIENSLSETDLSSDKCLYWRQTETDRNRPRHWCFLKHFTRTSALSLKHQVMWVPLLWDTPTPHPMFTRSMFVGWEWDPVLARMCELPPREKRQSFDARTDRVVCHWPGESTSAHGEHPSEQITKMTIEQPQLNWRAFRLNIEHAI